MIYLHKILPLLASPLFAVFFLVLGGIIFRSRKTSLVGLVLLFVCSLPILSDRLIAYLEKDYQLERASNFHSADAIVVLSGMVRTIQTKKGLDYEWSEASDRIFAGIDLFKAQKAPLLILTRGKLPWSAHKPEGEYLFEVAIKGGVAKESIILTKNVENTDQEAQSVKNLLKDKKSKIILVTSAFHMPRALKVFEAAGVSVIPFPVDFRSGVGKFTVMHLIPSARALRDTSFFVREMIGRIYYNLKY
jgi:uncharacterized SAM-binding protein YcdF (DUF218 family)